MYIVFRAILNVTTEMSRDLAWCKRVVVDVAFDSVEFFSLISKDFEKSTATGSGAAQDDWGKLAKYNDTRLRIWHSRSISPGRTTPENPVIIFFRGGCLKERILVKIFNGLRRDPRVGWRLAETSKPTTRRFSKTTPSWRDFMSASSRLLKVGVRKR